MTSVIKPKRSNTSSAIPTTSDLADGELAVNTADEKIYLRVGNDIITVASNSAGASITDTDDLSEGSTNLYYTNARVDAEIDSYLSGGTGITVSGGAISIDFTEFSTTNITEGTNLYYTDSRVDARITASGAEANAVDSVNTQTGAVVLDADDISDSATTNKFTTAGDISKLAGIESGATADQTGAEIKTAYEAEADTNAFDDAAVTKLAGIEASADVTDTANVTAAGALMDSEVTNLAQVKAFDSSDYATAAQGTTADAALPKTGGAMTGPITTNSTFDGRDVATDGAKLDGIETGATADQTAAEILAAIKTVDGATSGLDADLLDGNHASAFATAAQGTKADSALQSETVTSIALNSNSLDYTDENGTTTNIDLSAYLDEDSRAIASGTLNSVSGVVTFTRDDATTFTLDLSDLLDDTNLVTSVAGKNGVVTLDADDIDDTSTTNKFTTAAEITKLSGIETGADVTDTTNVVAALTAGTNVTIGADGTISSTDTNTTYSVGDGGLTEKNFTTTLKSKLDGIEASATNTADPAITTNGSTPTLASGITAAEVRTLIGAGTSSSDNATHTGEVTGATVLTVASNVIDADNLKVTGNGTTSQFLRSDGDGTFSWATPTDTNTTYSVGDGGLTEKNFTAALNTKLSGIETGATADQTASEILTAIKTVDGSGSGLDADLLDGIDSSGFTSSDHFKWRGTAALTSTTTSDLKTELVTRDVFDSYVSAFKTTWSYGSNGDLTDAGRFTEMAGTSWLTWTDDSTDNTSGNFTALAIAPNTGASAGKVFIYNDQGASYSPGWREVWTSASDGAGSGLDADLLDGAQGSLYARLADPTFTGTPDAPTAATGTNTTQIATTAFVQQEIAALKALLYAYDQS